MLHFLTKSELSQIGHQFVKSDILNEQREKSRSQTIALVSLVQDKRQNGKNALASLVQDKGLNRQWIDVLRMYIHAMYTYIPFFLPVHKV